MNLAENSTLLLLLNISVMLLFARAFGELLRKFKQPAVIGEIFAGIVLGPTILGSVFPDLYKNLFTSSANTQNALDGITTLAVVMLMLVSGLEVDLNIVFRQKKATLTTSLLGIIVPFSVGFITAYYFPSFLGGYSSGNTFIFALFIGTALSITALPVVARTLMDLNILKTEIGFLIISSAMFDDVIGLLIFSLILGMTGGAVYGFSIGTLIAVTILFLIFTLFIGKKLINKILPVIQKKISYPGGVLSFILILGFLGAAFTEYLGLHAIFGAFIIGIAIGDSAHLKENTREVIYQFVTNIFAPLFFVSIGLRINLISNFDPVIVLFFIVLAFIGKIVGCTIGAYWGGLDKNDSLAVGFGMNSRGAIQIVLGVLALQNGLINEKVFVAMVIMSLVTSLSSAPLMSIFLRKSKRFLSFAHLLKPGLIFFSNAASKVEIIDELADRISGYSKIDKDIILKKLLEREEQMSTGIGRQIAIPHAKINGCQPVISAAVCRNGIDYGSPDGLPAKIIICLITPGNHPEIQLKLLAEISNKFKNRNLAMEIISLNHLEDVLKKLISIESNDNQNS